MERRKFKRIRATVSLEYSAAGSTQSALTYDLSYDDLKTLARNSLEYAFLSGDSLWRAKKRRWTLQNLCEHGATPQTCPYPHPRA